MQYRNLGHSNLKVSALCLGTMMFGDQTAQPEAQAIVADAHAHGVNYIDTADVYSKGASETMVGTLLKGQRHDWVLATKLGNKMSERVNEGHYSRSWMLRNIAASLARLQTDYVDILYLHLDHNGMNLEEPLRALDAMLRAGQIRYWGVSNFRGWRIAEELFTDGVYVGPEAQYFGSNAYRQYRAGLHITSMKTEITEWSAAAGLARDTDGTKSLYVRLGLSIKLAD